MPAGAFPQVDADLIAGLPVGAAVAGGVPGGVEHLNTKNKKSPTILRSFLSL
jgi:hypothetical protein